MKDLDHFIAQQRLIYPLSDEAIRKLTDEMEEVFIPKGGFSVYEGDRDPYVWFVKDGLTRSFVERDMRDVTLWFASSGEIVNMSYREIAAYNLEMVEDTVLLRIPARRLEELCEQTLELANWMRKLLDYYLREYENYFINDSWSDAREQYENLLRTRPDLFQRVPLKHIASFLQITPQSLSRIRSSVK
ncbi:Crp/Fnr family transcriptional regulator [Parabacteroides sp. AF48-14]|uniref:Crp/Fnr family transcriptional regulator n=1 Tax=Parabacteroides sp. AF48-14 TaxID=2292052 RepID=UPI000EFE996A|nr:Crp/Fnr family transcriptional regulator [Parabacteroides sp. AF48-14]RHO71456.1 Crp/Fnr family transcriptional regulator [Parabacteroides sp. AF48-14]